MDLTKLFEQQRLLDEHINYKKYDSREKKVVALMVEVSEWANENRWFKFWSENQMPRREAVRVPAMMEEDKEYYNPELEEHIDGWHFVFSLGLEIEFAYGSWELKGEQYHTLTEQFIAINQSAITFWKKPFEMNYVDLFEQFLGLSEMLGFTWEEIEDAYYAKNKINHQRQEAGY